MTGIEVTAESCNQRPEMQVASRRGCEAADVRRGHADSAALERIAAGGGRPSGRINNFSELAVSRGTALGRRANALRPGNPRHNAAPKGHSLTIAVVAVPVL